jgi:oligopeptide transport system ATP-binding protein
MSVIFEVNDLNVSFGSHKKKIQALKQISFTLKKGEVLGLVGESGSGKSTTGRVLSGLLKHYQGQVKYQGVSLKELNKAHYRKYRKNVQMIFQDPYASLDSRMKVGEIIAEGIDNFHLVKTKEERAAKVAELLVSVGLKAEYANRYPHEFSGGQRQRIGIARSLAVEPEVLIADEPISALDVGVQAEIVNLLKKISREKSLTLLFISHDLSMVHYLSDRIIVMNQGELVESGDTDEVYQNPTHPYTKQLLASIPKFG